MSFSVNTNSGLMAALQNFKTAGNHQVLRQDRVQTGLRIQDAVDDASNFAVAQGVRTDVRAWQSVQQGIKDNLGALRVALEGANQISDMLAEMKAKAYQASDPALTDAQKDALQRDVDAMSERINQVVENAKFGNVNLLSGVEPVDPASKGTQTTVDMVFVLDISGSMTDPIQKVKDGIGDLLENFDSQGISYRLGLTKYIGGAGLVSFGGQTWTSDRTNFENQLFLGASSYVGSATTGSPNEQGTFALEMARLNYAFNSNAERHFVLVTDEPVTDGAPAGGAPTEAAIGASLAGQNITTHVIGRTSNSAYVAEYDAVRNPTGGEMINIDSTDYAAQFDGLSSDIASRINEPTATGDKATVLINKDGGTFDISHRPMSTASLKVNGLSINSNPSGALTQIEAAIEDVHKKLGKLGADYRQMEEYSEAAQVHLDSTEVKLGAIVDADMGRENAKLAAAEIQRQLASESINIAGKAPEMMLRFFNF